MHGELCNYYWSVKHIMKLDVKEHKLISILVRAEFFDSMDNAFRKFGNMFSKTKWNSALTKKKKKISDHYAL